MAEKRKQYLWFPYASKIKISPKKIMVCYKGGEETIEWKKIHSIMFYGESTDFSQDFLEKASFYKIPIIIHRRNVSRAVFISSTLSPDQENILENQVIFRRNIKKRSYIAKKLLQAKFKSMKWLVPLEINPLYRVTNLDKMIRFEAWHSKIFWKEYYKRIGINGSRRGKNGGIVKKCLDATSKFVSGVLLRWIIYHNLNPFLGFIHKPTTYPSLVYDLIEPYRGYFDKIVFNTIKEDLKNKNLNEEKMISHSIENLKVFLDTKVYVEATRQTVTFQELLHGIVLALRVYLLKETRRFVVPIPSKPNGGRPIKAGYKLYGHQAGKTNFWPETKQIDEDFEKIMKIND